MAQVFILSSMDIVKFLLEEHNGLRKELRQLKGGLAEPGFVHHVQGVISRVEWYETLESRLFAEIKKFHRNETVEAIDSLCKKANKQVWALLDRLIDDLGARDASRVNSGFFDLCSYIEMHSAKLLALLPTLSKMVGRIHLEGIAKKISDRQVFRAVKSPESAAGHMPYMKTLLGDYRLQRHPEFILNVKGQNTAGEPA